MLHLPWKSDVVAESDVTSEFGTNNKIISNKVGKAKTRTSLSKVEPFMQS